MAFRRSTQSLNRVPALAADGAGDALTIVGEYVVTAATANTDIIEMCALPAGCVVARLTLVADDIDTANTVTLDVGLMSGSYLNDLNDDMSTARTCGAEFLSADTTARAGGVVVSAVKAGHLLAPSLSDRSIGVKITAAMTAIVNAKIRLYVEAVPVPPGIAFA
jgi:hypothetical protein